MVRYSYFRTYVFYTFDVLFYTFIYQQTHLYVFYVVMHQSHLLQ